MTTPLDPEEAMYGPKFLSFKRSSGASTGSFFSVGYADSASITAAAGTWQTMLDVAGEGVLVGAFASLLVSAAGQSINLRLTLDGVEYTGASQPSVSTNETVFVLTACGLGVDSGNFWFASAPVLFKFATSLKIEAMRGVAGTATCAWTHYLRRN